MGFETTEIHIYGEKGANNMLSKGLTIIIKRLNRGAYFADKFGWIPNDYKLESEIKKINGKNYHQCIFASSFFFETRVRDIVYDNGYVIPSCLLLKGLARDFSAEGDSVMFIYYFEDISNFGTPRKYYCSEWIGINKLKEDQQKRLDAFKTASQTNIKFSE